MSASASGGGSTASSGSIVSSQFRRIRANSKFGELSLARPKLESIPNSYVYVDFASGTVGGLAQLFVGFPFDTIKTITQAGVSTQLSPMDSAKRILDTQGPRGFYRGMMAPLAMVASQNALLFASTGVVKRLLRPDGGVLTATEAAFAGAVAGIPTALIGTPTELLKCRLQTQGVSPSIANAQPRKLLYKGPLDAMKVIMRTEGGFSGLFRGFTPTLTREIIGNACYFGTYSLIKTKLAAAQGLESSRSLGTGSLMVAGGIAGAAFWLPIIPFDTIKTIMQLQSPHDPHRHLSMIGCASHLIKNEGFPSLFRGWQPCLARSVPANAALFVAVEATQSFLSPV